jgi:glycosyltransferase involved in cell wall biosynthesis
MKVHHVTPRFHPEKGGVESSVQGLARHLVQRGHEVVVHTSARGLRGETFPTIETVEGIVVRRYRPNVRLGYYATFFRPDVGGADLVHLHGYGFLTNDGVARRVRGAIPLVYSLHHGVAQRPPSLGAAWKWRTYHALQGRATLHRSAAIIASSASDRDWLTARGFPAERVHVVPTGLERAAFEQGSAERARSRFGLDRYVIFLGRLHGEKSPDHLLRALANLPEWKRSIAFVGPDGGMRASLEALAKALGIGDRVVFTGEVDEETKRDLLAGATCLVLPSFYEAQGIAILEAWAQRIPVVASRVGGVPDMVEQGINGLLYAWGDLVGLRDALRRILSDDDEAARMGRAGEEKARSQFTWEFLAPRFEALYNRALQP